MNCPKCASNSLTLYEIHIYGYDNYYVQESTESGHLFHWLLGHMQNNKRSD